MEKKLTEETLKKIILLDEQTENLKQRIEIDSKEKERLFKKELREMETSYMEEVRVKARKDYKSIIDEADVEKARIIKESIEKSNDLEKLLYKKKDELLRKIFLKLFEVELGE
ncbi:MAG: hypothetical protein U9Q80_02665 [Bacillota bacterium]|nr:hypothetical protein [Bacillota bacterium]